jgi:hypothetical protein
MIRDVVEGIRNHGAQNNVALRSNAEMERGFHASVTREGAQCVTLAAGLRLGPDDNSCPKTESRRAPSVATLLSR